MRRKAGLSWFGPAVGKVENEYLTRIIQSNYINDGDATREFEKKLAAKIGVNYCVGVTSGTSAIALALMGLGVGAGDEVLVPDLTFIATANAARLAGATVRLVDVEPLRLTMDPDKVKRSIGAKTKAVVSVDVNGRGCFYDELEPWLRKKGLFLVTDSCEALGSKYRGQFLGSFGDAGCFSFSANKTVTMGQGGAVATNSKALFNRLIQLKDQGRPTQGTGGNDLHPHMGFNFKLTNLQAAVGLAQWEKLKQRLLHARQRDRWYRNFLEGVPGVRLFPWDEKGGEIFQWADVLIDKRGRVSAALARRGIGFRHSWFPLHTQRPYRNQRGSFPVASAASLKMMWLPSSFDLTQADARLVSDVIRNAASS